MAFAHAERKQMPHLGPEYAAELEEALDEANREEGISGDELLEKLRKYD